MSRINRVIEPTAEVMMKLYQAKIAVATQHARVLKCPYCGRSVLIVYEDTSGHIQTKCRVCGQAVLFAVRSKEEYYS